MANIQFEDIEPWIGENQGDTGLTARQKLKRNFDKIKAWIDALQTDRFFDEVTLENGSKAVKLKTSYTGLFTDGFLAALGVGSEQGGGGGGGSVTSIGMSVPQGFTVSPSSISQSGTFAIGFASGYSLPSNNLQDSWTAKQDAISDLATIRQNAANGNTAYESLNGYALKSYLEGNWLVKSLSSIRQSPATVLGNGDEVVCGVSLNSGVLQVSYGNLSIPTKTSDLMNDSGFITLSALSGYATQSWVQNTALSGFATEDYVDTELASAISDMATKTWVGNNYLPLTGGTLTGNLTIGNVTIYRTGSNGGINSILIGDDAYIGDGNMAGGIGIKAKNSNVQAGIKFFTNEDKSCGELLARADKNLTYEGNLIWHAGNDGSGSGLDADTLDGVHLAGLEGMSGVMRSWARGTFTTVKQYFGNGNVVVIDPQPTDDNTLWSNTTIFSLGDRPERNHQLAFGYGADVIRYRRNGKESGDTDDGWKPWRTIAFIDDNVASATKLATARSLWGQSFDGSGDISGSLSGVTDVHMTGQLTLNGQENNAICNVANANGAISVNRFESTDAIRNALSFQWYGTDWQIGNIRGGGTNSHGFGITKGNNTLVFAVNETRAYIPGSVGIGTPSPSYNLDVAGTLYASSNITTGGDFYAGGRLYLHQGSGNYGFYIEGVGPNNNNMSICQHYGNVYQRTFLSLVPDAVQGTNCANDVYIPNGRISIGGVSLRYDSANNALVVESRAGGTANLYATGGLACLGIGSGSSGSVTNLTVTSSLNVSGAANLTGGTTVGITEATGIKFGNYGNKIYSDTGNIVIKAGSAIIMDGDASVERLWFVKPDGGDAGYIAAEDDGHLYFYKDVGETGVLIV